MVLILAETNSKRKGGRVIYYKDLDKGLRSTLENNGLVEDPAKLIGRKFRMIVLEPREEGESSLYKYASRAELEALLETADSDAEDLPCHDFRLYALYGTVRGIFTDDIEAWVLLIDPLETESGRFASIHLSGRGVDAPSVRPTALAGIHTEKPGRDLHKRSLPCVLTLL